MLEGARAKLPRDAALTTEENTECWLDQLDALLLVNTPNSAKIIPLFPSVYSGRTIVFGFHYINAEDFAEHLPFRAKMARAFVWGSQVGWVRVREIMAPEAAKEAEFLRTLARCRRFGHKFLLHGRFLGALDAFGDNPRMSSEAKATGRGGKYEVGLPVVFASGWLAEDGSLGVALANASDKPRAVEVKLPLIAAGIQPGSKLKVEEFGPEGPVGSSVSESAMQKVTVPERGAVILSITRQ